METKTDFITIIWWKNRLSWNYMEIKIGFAGGIMRYRHNCSGIFRAIIINDWLPELNELITHNQLQWQLFWQDFLSIIYMFVREISVRDIRLVLQVNLSQIIVINIAETYFFENIFDSDSRPVGISTTNMTPYLVKIRQKSLFSVEFLEQ